MNDNSPDGNRRVIRNQGGVEVPDLNSGPSLGATRLHSTPDGVIDMRDFRRFRDAVLQSCADAIATTVGCPSCEQRDARRRSRPPEEGPQLRRLRRGIRCELPVTGVQLQPFRLQRRRVARPRPDRAAPTARQHADRLAGRGRSLHRSRCAASVVRRQPRPHRGLVGRRLEEAHDLRRPRSARGRVVLARRAERQGRGEGRRGYIASRRSRRSRPRTRRSS